MAPESYADQRVGRHTVDDDDPVAQIETEMAVLARVLESLHRRADIYREIDRASYLIARTLEITGPISVNGLASMLTLDATTVTRQIAKMESARLIRRRSDPRDGRVRLISLSAIGRRKMRNVQQLRQERIAELLGEWTESDRRELGRLLSDFNDELSRALAPGLPAQAPGSAGQRT